MPFDIHAKDGAIQEQIVEAGKKRVGFQGGMMCIIGRHGTMGSDYVCTSHCEVQDVLNATVQVYFFFLGSWETRRGYPACKQGSFAQLGLKVSAGCQEDPELSCIWALQPPDK